MKKHHMPKTLLTLGALIALAFPSSAADPKVDDNAGNLEAQAMGFWAPDREAMLKAHTEKGINREDAEEAVDESAGITLRLEKGKIFFYSRQGAIAVPYEVRKRDLAKKILTVAQPGADREPVEAIIGDDRITVAGPMPFIFRRIEEEEFKKRIKDVPGHENPQEPAG